MQGGCVLVGYPNKQEELMVLEEKLAEKHYPPYGSYNYIKNQNLTLLVPFKSPNLGGKRRYKSSLTSYLKVRILFYSMLLLKTVIVIFHRYYPTKIY